MEWFRSLQGRSQITHLQYTIDTLIFCPSNVEILQNIMKVLIIFHLASGLQVNFHKFSLVGINTSTSWMKNMANALFCKMDSLPFVY